MKHLRYLRYVLTHKLYVLAAGLHLGVPLWRLIIHDWTKFLPCEWSAYADRFFGSGAKTEAFAAAWDHHKRWNDHHWQYWVAGGEPLVMPDVCVREMVADWTAMERSFKQRLGRDLAWRWYQKNADTLLLHKETRTRVESLLRGEYEGS